MSIEWIGDSINDLSVVSMALRMVLSMVCSGVIGLERGRANQPAGMVSMALRMVLSMVCSGVIGLERGRANQPAGMRTYMGMC